MGLNKYFINSAARTAFRLLSGCNIIYRTQWYKDLFVDPDHTIYPDNTWYRNHEDRNFDIVNLGSSSGKWAFDYSGLSVKGMNWAQQPQPLLEDYNLFRHYPSILRQGGFVLITIMPFSGLNKKTGLMDAVKYINLDCQGEPIEPYQYADACRFVKYPILFKKPAIKALVKYLLGKEGKKDVHPYSRLENNPMSLDELETDAEYWVNAWKVQFSINDFDDPLTLENLEGRRIRIAVMRSLIDFCIDRGYRPVYVIPPVTNHLAKFFTPKFEQTYIYDFLSGVDRQVELLDYSKQSEFAEDSLYFNSFFLNVRGRQLFTRRVLDDLKM